MDNDRFDRNVRFFRQEGQARLRAITVALPGVGGLGTHIAQQLSLLGIGGLNLIDPEELAVTNLNRYIGARHDDPIPGSWKVDLGERLVHSIDPSIRVKKVRDSFISESGFQAIKEADYVIGSFDCEGARLILTELCAAYSRPYFDLATEILPGAEPKYGGRVCAALDGTGCLSCLGVLDVPEAQQDLAGPAARRDREAIYGVKRDALDTAGPSVVSLNGVVASLAVTEFMAAATGLRPARQVLNYYGHLGKVIVNTDRPRADCYYCKAMWGKNDQADVERHLRSDVARWLR